MRVRVEVIVRVRATLRTQATLAERDGMGELYASVSE